MGVGGSAVDAAIGWLVQSILGSLLTDNLAAWTREAGLDGDVRRLEREMRTVEAVLAAARGRGRVLVVGNEPLARSLEDLRQVLYDAEDVVDELEYYRRQREIEQGDGGFVDAATRSCLEGSNVSSSKSTLSSSTSQLMRSATGILAAWALTAIDFVAGYPRRKRKRGKDVPAQDIPVPLENERDISHRINEIASQLCIVGDTVMKVLHLGSSFCIATPTEGAVSNNRLTTSVPVEKKVYGRDTDREKIVQLLIKEKFSDLHVLPIVGNGGVGKTTLARFVYRDQRITNYFDLQMWVCVSSNFDEVRLTREMLDHVCTERQNCDKLSSLNVLQEMLMDRIRNKKILLVLDDVWEDKDKNRWTRLLAPLLHSQIIGCMILATTRSSSVAKMIGTLSTVNLKGLDDDEFWLFFKECAFGDENLEGHPSLQVIGQQIAKTLKGYPLAAESVGALLRQNHTYEHWWKIQGQWTSLQKSGDDILPVLKLSYDYLPFHLQRCFSYCSLFPKDHKFDGDKLIRAWISQSFVYCKDASNRVEDTGRQYLDRLVDLGFFQKDSSYYVMHDLMHELAEMVSSSECATIDCLKSKTIPSTIRHLSIITYANDEVEHDNFPTDKFEKQLEKIRSLQQLRTLMFFGHGPFNNLLRYFQILCKDAKGLRFLRVHYTCVLVDALWNSIKPFHLRYIEFFGSYETSRWCNTKDALLRYYAYPETSRWCNAYPEVLPRFYHLQALDAGYISYLVPSHINSLVNLRHLIADGESQPEIVNVGKMTSLQELKNFRVQNAGGFEIGQLRSMNELLKLGVFQLENIETKEEASGARLIDKDHLEELCLSWDNNVTNFKPTTVTAAEEVLEALQPNRNVKHIQINGYSGAIGPMWLGSNFSVRLLQSLHLENCSNWRVIQLERIASLGRLKLINMWTLVNVSVPCLEKLVLCELPNLERCIGAYKRELTSYLRVLRMERCAKLKDFTLFQSCDHFKVEQKTWFPFLSKLIIKNCPQIMQWTILPFEEMHSLVQLELTGMPGVKEVSVPSLIVLVLNDMPNLECCTCANEDRLSSSIAVLRIENCRRLTRIQVLQVPSPHYEEEAWLPNMNELTVHNCPHLIVSCPLPPSAKLSKVSVSIRGVLAPPSIEMYKDGAFFTIESYELSVLDQKRLAFNNLTSILNFRIINCPDLVSLSFEALSQLISLERLEIDNCPRLLWPQMAPEAGYQAKMKFPSITHLSIVSSSMMGERLLLPSTQSPEMTMQGCSNIGSMPLSPLVEEQRNHLSLLYISSSATSTARASARDAPILFQIPHPIHTFVKKLHISDCPELVFCNREGFAGFTSLEELTVTGCPKLVLSMVHEVENDDYIEGRFLLPPLLNQFVINHFPARIQPYFPEDHTSLRRLLVWDSRRLISLQLHSCKHLEELEIINCEHLSVLGGLALLNSLRILKFARNPKLTTAWEFNCQDQQGREDHTGGLNLYSRLEWLETDDFSILTMSFCKHLTSLQHLTLSSSRSNKRMVSLSEEQERALQQLTSLQELQLLCCDDLLSLPVKLHCLSSLKKLEISYCPGLSKLPEEGLPFSSLEELDIRGCSEELNIQCRLASTKNLKVLIDGEIVDNLMA